MSDLLRPAASRLAATLAAPADGALSAGRIRTAASRIRIRRSLKILHILRAPLGGLFRHVRRRGARPDRSAAIASD